MLKGGVHRDFQGVEPFGGGIPPLKRTINPESGMVMEPRARWMMRWADSRSVLAYATVPMVFSTL